MRIIAILFVLPLFCFAQPKSTISGKVLGTDGRPLAMAHVGLSGGAGWEDVYLDTHDKMFSSVLVDTDGSFSISTDSLGALMLWCTGVGCNKFIIQIILEHPATLELNVKLESFRFTPNADGIEVLYDFDEVTRGKRAVMKETSAQIYETEIPTVKKELKYRINSVVTHPLGISIPYATHNGFEYYMDGMYTTIIYPRYGKATISLDYSKAGKNPESASYAFSDPRSVQARFASYYFRSLKEKERYDKALYDHMAAGKKYDQFVFDWVPFASQMKRDLEREEDQVIADELVIEYLEMAVFSKDRIFSDELAVVETYDHPAGNSTVRKTLNGISAQSPVWVYHKAIALQAAKYHPLKNAYVEKILQTHPSRSFQGYLTFRKFSYLQGERNNPERERLYSRLVNEYAETPSGNSVKRSQTFREQLTIGIPLPAFHFTDLENAAKTFTNDDFRGKYFLLGFWATWCGPCVQEIPYLEKAYEKYHPYGLEILSVSNEKSSVINYFRSTRFAMPWHHSVVEEAEQGNVQQRFSVCTPKTILVGPDGVVLEIYNGFSPDVDFDAILTKYYLKQ
jgi:thiol-disulfide isomerase/thioredoxin